MKFIRKLVKKRINNDCPIQPDIGALRKEYEALIKNENQKDISWKSQETAGKSGANTS